MVLSCRQGGDRLLGGHSCRVIGARMLSAMGIELMVIMLLARWGSAVVLRYVQDAPLAALTNSYNELVAKSAMPDLIRNLSSDFGELSRLFKAQTSHLEDLQREVVEQKANNSARASAHSANLDGPKFVVNTNMRRVHVVAIGSHAYPVKAWRTTCRWAFATTEHDLPGNKITELTFSKKCET